MSYIDKVYYDNEYKGIQIDEDTFSRLSERSTEIIDILTNYKLIGTDIEELAPFIRMQIKKATASQIEYLFTSGESNAIGGGGFSQVRAGNFTYGDKAGKESISRAETMTSQKVTSILSSTGLLYGGVDVYD